MLVYLKPFCWEAVACLPRETTTALGLPLLLAFEPARI